MEEQGSESGSQQKAGGPHHVHVVCDGCNSEIYGVRYKCLVCADYDLCSSCEKKGEHVEHNMVSISDPQSYNPWGFPHGGRCGGPWRGRRGGRHCGVRRHHGGPWAHGGPWVPPFFLQNFLGGQWGGEPGAGQQNPPPPGEKPAGAKSEEMETEESVGQSGGKQAQLEKKQQQSYLQDIGEAVSTFLRPFGVKVDVDVVDDEQPKKTESQADTSDPPPSAPSKVPEGNTVSSQSGVVSHRTWCFLFQLYPTLDDATTAASEGRLDPIEAALSQLQGMGFDNEGGWLTELIKAKGGDIGKVLDALHPSQSE